jgi:hypothetical protein
VLGVRLRQRQPGLAKCALELAEQIRLPDPQGRRAAGEKDLPSLARLVAGFGGHRSA